MGQVWARHTRHTATRGSRPAARGTPRRRARGGGECEGRVRTPDRRQSHAHNGKPHAHRRSRRRDRRSPHPPVARLTAGFSLESYNHRGFFESHDTRPLPNKQHNGGVYVSVPGKRTCRMIYSGRHGRQRTSRCQEETEAKQRRHRVKTDRFEEAGTQGARGGEASRGAGPDR